jgi:hypothetical protein
LQLRVLAASPVTGLCFPILPQLPPAPSSPSRCASRAIIFESFPAADQYRFRQ